MRTSSVIYTPSDEQTREYIERHGVIDRWRTFSREPYETITGSIAQTMVEIARSPFNSFLTTTSEAHVSVSPKTGRPSRLPNSHGPAAAHLSGGLAIAYVASQAAHTLWADVDAFIMGRYGINAEGLRLDQGKKSAHEFASAVTTRSRALLSIGLAVVSAVHQEMTGPLTRVSDLLLDGDQYLRFFEAGVGLSLGVLVSAESVALNAASIAANEFTSSD